ncbi:hypothetical protein [uncultured Mailhella sp.]|uniref:hypothetical protein n=1 Tax=uncultured Mailhella sp. TaxID=1981031 RepID=UPI0026339292|nr:hypothetical protein [uncultured Mailhella sp.]
MFPALAEGPEQFFLPHFIEPIGNGNHHVFILPVCLMKESGQMRVQRLGRGTSGSSSARFP